MATTILSGPTRAVADDLLQSSSATTRVIAIASTDWDDATFGAVRDVMASICEVLPQCLMTDGVHTRRTLLDQIQLLPLSASITRDELRQVIAARTKVLSSTIWLTAESLAARSVANSPEVLQESLEKWCRRRQCFGLPQNQRILYPAYAFDLIWARPYPVIEVILRAFTHMSAWEVAYWFGSANAYLKGQRPQDLLVTDGDLVVSAAQAITRDATPP